MGRVIYAAALLLALVCIAHAADPVDVVTTTDGKTFKNVTVVRVKGDKVLLSYHNEDGIAAALVALDSLSDDTRKALGLRTRVEQAASDAKQAALTAEQAAFEAEQAKKGLVKFGADWVTPEEKKSRQLESVVDAGTLRSMSYKISQALENGSLCYMGRNGDGEQFFLYGKTNKDVVDDQVCTSDLYYTGRHYTYTTVSRAPRTVAAFACDRDLAIKIVKETFNPAPTSPPSTKSAGLDNVRGFGTGFAITEDGYIITAYHVIRDAKSIRVKTEKVKQAFLGVEIQQLPHELAKSHGADGTEGVLIRKAGVDPRDGESRPATNSDGGKADLRNGDIITNVGGRAVKSIEQFQQAVASMSPGDKVSVAIIRDGKVQTTEVVLGERTTELLAAEVVAADRDNDLVLLKVNKKTECVAFSSARTASLGQTVFTVGFPMPDLQGFSPKVTKGVISGLKGMKDDVRKYQIDASVQPGNSGGPLADEGGNLVGVVVAKLNDAAVMEDTGVVPQNVNYTVKLSYVFALVDANPEVAKKIHVAKDNAKVSFEEAVEKVRKATVLVASY